MIGCAVSVRRSSEFAASSGGLAHALLCSPAARGLCAKESQSSMSSNRLWALLFSVSALVTGCGDEELPQRCGQQSEDKDRCREDAGEPPVEQDAGSAVTSAPDASPPDAAPPAPARADAGESDPEPDDFRPGQQCTGPNRYFAPGCQSVTWQGSPESFAVQIAPGCYRPCTTARDAICGPGTRCGRAAFASTACNGSSCTQVCAETWLCLTLDRFPSDIGWEADAGVDDDTDAGWRW